MRLWILRWLFRLFDGAYRIDYIKIDKASLEGWLFDSWRRKGADEYYRLEDYKLLKALGMPQEEKLYWIFIGRRIQLMAMFDEMRKVAELRKSNEEKGSKKNDN